MFLSQLLINLRHRPARRDLGDRYELHRSLLCAFPAELPAGERVLYRVEHAPRQVYATVLLQSQTAPDWQQAQRLSAPGYLFVPPALREFEPRAQEGMRLRFRLQANPTVKRDGNRHAIYAEDALMRWLQRKSDAHGFAVEPRDVRTVRLGKLHDKRRRQTWHAIQFEGVLKVIEPESFIKAWRGGIGSAKAFGFGLLSVSRR